MKGFANSDQNQKEVDKPVLTGLAGGGREAFRPGSFAGGCGRWAWPRRTGSEPGTCQNKTGCK